MKLSVVVCTHNPKPRYFARVLEALRQQKLEMSEWELIVVDNASTNPVRDNWDISWHPNARHVAEAELGLAAARRRAVKEFSTNLLVFVDDDNVLNPDYLGELLRIEREWPLLGVWGSGCIRPEYEIPPERHHNEYLSVLVIRDIETPRWSNTFPSVGLFPEVTPWGAGICIRAELAHAYARAVAQSAIPITGRKGNRQFSGEDVEICFVACSYGWGMGIFPELKLMHLIPKERTTDDYFLRMGEFQAASNLLLEYKWHGALPRNPLSFRGILGLVKHAATERGFKRRIYFANVRGAIRACKIIAESRSLS
jgi:GT2 family glycosyltransferase